jgi:hypothetical protein
MEFWFVVAGGVLAMIFMVETGGRMMWPRRGEKMSQPEIAGKHKFKRGLKPTPRHVLAGAMPFRRTLKAIPPSFFIFPLKMSMWLNDQDGDCVTAEEAFNKACAGIFIQDDTVLAWCNANGTLNGADLQPVIQQMEAKGFSQDGNIYGDGNGLAINYADAPTLQAAIYQAGTGSPAGSIKIGIAADQLPSGAGNANGWFLPSDSPDTNEDHCVSLCGYGTAQQFVDAMNAAFSGLNLTLPSGVDPTMQGYALYTWKTIGFVATQALVNMTGEAWIRTPNTVTTGSGTPTPDTVYTTATPVPTPTPTPTPTPNPVPPTPIPSPTPTPVPVVSSPVSIDFASGDTVGLDPVNLVATFSNLKWTTNLGTIPASLSARLAALQPKLAKIGTAVSTKQTLSLSFGGIFSVFGDVLTLISTLGPLLAAIQTGNAATIGAALTATEAAAAAVLSDLGI